MPRAFSKEDNEKWRAGVESFENMLQKLVMDACKFDDDNLNLESVVKFVEAEADHIGFLIALVNHLLGSNDGLDELVLNRIKNRVDTTQEFTSELELHKVYKQ